MNYLVTIAHGADCFRNEAAYAVLSFLRYGMPRDGCTVLIVTDVPAAFHARLADRPEVRTIEVGRSQWDAWRGGPGGYVHRTKPQAILHAARRAGVGPTDALLFIDSDTSFLRDASDIFERIATDGQVFLHAREGTIAGNRRHSRSQARLHAASRRHAFDVGGKRIELAPDLPLWNSGVIGLRGDCLCVLNDALALTDQINATVPIAAAEQVALSAVLAQRRWPVEAAAPWVLHYHVFKEFREDLRAFFERHGGASADQLMARLDEIDPALRMAPKLAFNRLPKWWRQLRKVTGSAWRPLPYPWTHGSETHSKHP